MGKWKKWLSAGLFTAMLGTAIIAGPTADVSANAGNKPYNICLLYTSDAADEL